MTTEASPRTSDVEFVDLLTEHQQRIYAYILSLESDETQAADILQQSNVVLWEKRHQYIAGTDFARWAMRIAYYQTLSNRDRNRRDRLVFDDDLMRGLDLAATAEDSLFEQRQHLIGDCIEKLTPWRRQIVELRYRDGLSVADIADRLGVAAGAVKQSLFRARTALLTCVETRLSHDEYLGQ